MTMVIDERVKRLETGYRDGLYMNRWRYHDRDHEWDVTLPLEVPLPDGGLWKGIDYGLVIAETINTHLRELKHRRVPLIKTCVTR